MRAAREHVAQVGGAILVRRGTHGDELEEPVLDALDGIGGELDAAGFRVALDQRIEPGLVNGDLAAIQTLDLACVDVDTNDMIARIGQAGARDEAHVAGAENGYTHSVSS